MNSLSWMIYAADVVGGIGGIFTGVAAIAGMAGAVSLVVAALFRVYPCGDDRATSNSLAKLALYRCAPISVGAALIASVIPDPATIYAIAASEYGETMLESETGGKAVEALNAWLDRQIGENTNDQ